MKIEVNKQLKAFKILSKQTVTPHREDMETAKDVVVYYCSPINF